MNPKLEIVQKVMINYAKQYFLVYGEKWVPRDDHIRETLNLIEPPLGMPGLTLEDLMGRLRVFWRCKDDWLVSARHNYGLFTKHIHRWIQGKRQETPARKQVEMSPEPCRDCGTVLKANEVCPKCYPLCEKCHEQHAVSETCDEVAERLGRIKALFGHNGDQRIGKPVELQKSMGYK